MLTILPDWFWITVFTSFGLVIGSFLNVVVYRLHTGKSLSGHSHCESCGKRLSWYELFPVLSYLLARGRCISCGAGISARYSLVEVGTAILFVLAWFQADTFIELSLLLVLLSVLVVGLVYDWCHLIIPDEISILTAILGAGLFAERVIFHGESLWLTPVAALACSFALAAMWFVSKGRWLGLGDAKLTFGLVLAAGYSLSFSLIVLSFWIGALITVLVILLQKILMGLPAFFHLSHRLRVRMKSEVPFAPFLILSFLLVYFWEVDVLSLTSYAIEFLYHL